MRRTLALVLAAVVSICLTACTYLGNSASDGRTTGVLKTSDAPLSVFMDDVYGYAVRSEAEQSQMAQLENDVQARIAACMSDEGFDYTPMPYVAPAADEVANDRYAWDTDSRDLVSQHGYGFVSSPEPEGNGAEPTPKPQVDANTAYRDSLTVSEQGAYDEALYRGYSLDEGEGGDPATPGCLAAARSELHADRADVRAVDQFAPLFDAVDAFYGNRLQWAGMSALEGEWAECMAEHDYPGYEQQPDPSAEIGRQLSALRQTAQDSGGTASEDDLSALAKKERELALADLDCRESTDYTARLSSLWYAAEEQFIADHRADIDAAQAWLDQADAR